MEMCIGYKDEGSLIPRGRETPNKIQGHELWNNEVPTLNMEILVLAYTCRKWIVDPDLIKAQQEWHICTHENTCLRKVSRDYLQWTWHNPYPGQGSKVIPFFRFTTRLERHILAREPAAAKIWHTYHVLHSIDHVLVENMETTLRYDNYHVPMTINT